MKFKIALAIAAILIAIIAAYLLAPNGNNRSVERLENVVKYITPEAYLVSDRVYTLQNTEQGQRVALLPQQFDTGEFGSKPKFNRQEGFVGPDSCKECHSEYYEGFVQTAHYKTSAFANASSILGSFDPGQSEMKTKQPGFRYELAAEEGEYFQKLLVDENEKTYEHKCRFDIVTGSGNMGQTYLYWQDDFLFQLPVSWFAKSGWINSPGYPDGLANFARPIQEACMACHATLVKFADRRINLVEKEKMILGVTCERCHGPAESHVKFHRENPDADSAKFIVHPNDLPRERMNDICGQCHSGASATLQSPFAFRPGDSLGDFKRFFKEPNSGGSVHTANQHPRLVKSKCYSESDSMNCATCHNPHQNEHGNLKLFSDRCMKCHEPKDCGQFPESGMQIASNCIDCHMPKEDDTDLEIETTTANIFPQIRDHFIRIEQKTSNKVLESWTGKK